MMKVDPPAKVFRGFVQTVLLTLIGALVCSFQLWLVARVGTDVPFDDQWELEGCWLYPEWSAGRLEPLLLFRAHNEHHIVFTYLLNLLLFQLNGSWDPLLQQGIGVLLRGLCAVGVGAIFLHRAPLSRRSCAIIAGTIVIAYLPVGAWHNVLWGFQTPVWFSLSFGLLAVSAMPSANTFRKIAIAFVFALASQLSMGSGLVLFGGAITLLAMRVAASGGKVRNNAGLICLTALILCSALLLRKEVPEHASYHPATIAEMLTMFVKICSWPFYENPAAAVVLNVPFLSFIVYSARRGNLSVPEERIIATGGWALAMNAAMAWSRGASPEFEAAIPSRYIDFVVLLPLVNVWSALWWVEWVSDSRRAVLRILACSWGLVLLVGWAGACAPLWRGIIIPRSRDREAPVRLAVDYYLNRDRRVFINQPRLYVPNPNLNSLDKVFDNPALVGKLPPSFQPERTMGFGSRGIRFVVTHLWLSLAVGWFALTAWLVVSRWSLVSVSPTKKSQQEDLGIQP